MKVRLGLFLPTRFRRYELTDKTFVVTYIDKRQAHGRHPVAAVVARFTFGGVALIVTVVHAG